MFTYFVLKVKCTIFWLNRGLMVYLDLYALDFPKSTSKYFLQPSTSPLFQERGNDVWEGPLNVNEYFEDQRFCVQGYSWYLLAYHYQSNSLRGLQSFSTFYSFFAVWVVGIPTTGGFNMQLKSFNVGADPLIEHMVKF